MLACARLCSCTLVIPSRTAFLLKQGRRLVVGFQWDNSVKIGGPTVFSVNDTFIMIAVEITESENKYRRQLTESSNT